MDVKLKKFLIYAILFFAAYYLLFLAITTTYRHNMYTKDLINPSIPNRAQIVIMDDTDDDDTDTESNSFQESLHKIYEDRKKQILLQAQDNNMHVDPDEILQNPQLQSRMNSESVMKLKQVLGG